MGACRKEQHSCSTGISEPLTAALKNKPTYKSQLVQFHGRRGAE